MMKVAVLQLTSIGRSESTLENYIKVAQKKEVKLVLLGEYILNPFFKSLQLMSKSMIKEQSDHQIEIIKELSHKYDMTIVAPVVIIKKGEAYKSVIKVSPTSTSYYNQQVLINYHHWNEERYFSNEIEPIKSPLMFHIDKFKFAIMSGFELHFDKFFEFIREKNVDCVLVPSVSTFDSNDRWENLINIRSFTNSVYILRANRIGEHIEISDEWKFYGDSILSSPFGETVAHLGNKEELMIVDLDKESIKEARKCWGFKETLHKRV